MYWPLKAKSMKKSRKLKYIYIAATVLSFVLPLAFVIVTMAEFAVKVKNDPLLVEDNATFISGGLGYVNVQFPPITTCFQGSLQVTFFTFVFLCYFHIWWTWLC